MYDSNTELYCILGDPIRHSKSPVMHTLAFEHLNINSIFMAFSCNHDTVADAFQAIRSLDIKGGSITMPIKTDAMAQMDEIADDAKLIGSINTFRNENGRLKGYNTDGLGVVRHLESEGISLKTKVILAGAGGAGQSIAIQLALNGVQELIICNRTIGTAEALAKKINTNIPECHARVVPLDEEHLIHELQDATVLIDSTPFGMHPLEDYSILNNLDGVPKGVVFVDICYYPRRTKLLKLAEDNGFRVYNGEGMLLYQGVEAFRIWTGQEFPLDYIKSKHIF